jgi:ABC-type antimicrobial peptide transport system permease subunit
MSEEMKAELNSIRDEVNTQDVDRENAEDALFGGNDSLENDIEDDTFNALDSNEGERFSHAMLDTTFDSKDIDNGLAIHAAIILEPGVDQLLAKAEIEKAVTKHKLGLQVVGWEEASGLIGQFIVVLRVVLYIAIFIIFLVALVIINNSMVMATLERVTEIGTMRAIGAQQNFIMKLFLLEITILGIFSGLLGSGIGFVTIQWLGQVGIPAPSRQLIFLFSGPRLFPTISIEHILIALAVVLTVSLISTLYPARIATRIEPVTAMQAKE